jgi:hypothetical protein
MEIVEWKFIYIYYTLNQGTAVKKATVGPRQELDLRFRCSTLTNKRPIVELSYNGLGSWQYLSIYVYSTLISIYVIYMN